MNIAQLSKDARTNLPFYAERVDLACAFRWTARLNMHEAVANHFSLAVDDSGARFLMNPNQVHFSRIKASDLLLIDANDPETMTRPDAPDPTAWGLHGAVHRNVPHARCVMHVHSIHATVLASLADSTLPPIDQNSAMFFNRHVVDEPLWRARLRGGGRTLLAAARRSQGQGHGDGQSRHPGRRRQRRRRLQPHVLFRARRRDLHQGAVDRPAAAHALRRGRREGGAARWTTIRVRPNGTSPS